MNYIVYQAYGKKEIIDEALFSILTFLRENDNNNNEILIVIYTDNEAAFREVAGNSGQIIYETLTAESIKNYRGDINFVHRVKIRILQDFCAKYSGNLLYLDTDTVFLGNISGIFNEIENGSLYMHTCEGKIEDKSNIVFKKLYKFLKNTNLIPVSTEMWNAGLIGMRTTDHAILDKVLSFTDKMYPVYPKHIVEQLAFSNFFQQQQAKINPGDHVVFHYWNFKEFRLVLEDFFEYYKGKNLTELVELSSNISPVTLGKPKNDYQKLNGWKKLLRKLKGKRWEMPDYKL